MDIELENVSKSYNGKCALANIDLSIEKKNITAVIGPSGSGKTTLLRIINLLETPTEGYLRFDGTDPYGSSNGKLHDLRMKMALVFQNPSLFHKSVEANVAYGLRVRNLPRDEIESEVDRGLELVGLKELRHQFAPSLSAGESQRVSFARAIVFKPELLLLDEFTANLDPANVKLLEESVLEYQRETHATIILATHNLFQARRLADEIVFIFDGKIVERGEKEAFFSNPQNPLTRSFLSGELIY